MKLKKILQVSFLAIILLVATFNKANAVETPAPSSSKAITAFTIPNEVGTATIDETAHTVAITMPNGTSLSALTPIITLNDVGASVNPPSGTQEDFTNPQTYTVTAADTTTQDYTVTVTDQPSSGGGGSSQGQNTVSIHLTISSNSGSLYDQNINVSPCNNDNGSTNSTEATPYCGILQSGVPNHWTWFSFGALLDSLENIAGFTSKDKDNNDVFHFWDWSLNGTEASTGLTEYQLKSNDLISLNFIDPTPVVQTTTQGGTSGGGIIIPPAPKPAFDIKKALDFLSSEQKTDGSFGEDIYTDWTTLSFASSPNYQNQTAKISTYFSGNKLLGNLITDYERHAMALMALGLNPYNTNGQNYISKIVSSFDGAQFGDAHQDNDDIFALIVLQNAGYNATEKMISDDISFILKAQNDNGSWDSSVDMTGAAIEALSAFNENGQVKTALTKAENFLKQNQKDDGSWNDNASSTAWAIEGITAFGENSDVWKKGENTPLDYLATLQDTDGGIKYADINTKIWETAYVTSALSGRTWNQVMQKFDKQTLPTMTIVAQKPQKTTAQKIKVATKNIAPAKNNIADRTIKTNLENTASVINATSTLPDNSQRNWFMKLLGVIFGF